MKYARQCSVTGEGMNEGWLQGDGEQYFKYEKDVIAWLREEAEHFSYYDIITMNQSDDLMLKEAVECGVLYWTAWEDESEHQYEEINGKLIEIQ